MVIGMGGMACTIESKEGRWVELLSQRYEGFLSRKAPHFSIDVEVVFHPGENGSPLEVQQGPVKWRHEDQTLRLHGETFAADFDFAARKGRIRQSLNLSPLDLLIKAVYATYLLQHDGLFLHACAVVRRGKGYLFFGPTGSGKSTLARLAGEGVLADEFVIVKRQGSADDLPYSVFGTPFWGGINRKAPLVGLFALHPSPSTYLTPLTPVAGLRRLLPSIGSLCLSPNQQARLFELAGLLVQQVPCYELHFSLDPMLWSYLDAHTS